MIALFGSARVIFLLIVDPSGWPRESKPQLSDAPRVERGRSRLPPDPSDSGA